MSVLYISLFTILCCSVDFASLKIFIKESDYFFKNESVADRNSFPGLFYNNGMPTVGDIPVLNRKVFRARNVKIEEHPYLASIRRNVSHYLTGSLLSRSVVITVARPLTGVPTYELSVVAGESYSDRGIVLNDVVIVAIHPFYDRVTLNNDIAMLRLYMEYVYSVAIKPIKFPNGPPLLFDNLLAFVTGWGRCDFSGKELCMPRSSKYFSDEIMDPLLKTADIPFRLNNSDCARGYLNELALRFNHDSLCQGDARENNIMAPCLGVPGAPMAVSGKIIGILSWGLGCGYKSDLPLIYTNIFHHRNWIRMILEAFGKISKSDLMPLREASHIYLAKQNYFRSLNVFSFGKQILPPQDLVFQPFDKILASVPARFYDMRDYIFKIKYHERKKNYYTQILKKSPRLEKDLLLYRPLDLEDDLFASYAMIIDA